MDTFNQLSIGDLGALGEFAGAFLLFVSLVYVALQIRQNTKIARAESSRYTTDQFTNIDLLITGNPDLREALVTFVEAKALAEVDLDLMIRVNAVLQAYINTFSRAYDEHQSGIVSSADWAHSEQVIRSNLVPNSLFREWWQVRAKQSSLYGGLFKQWLNEEIELWLAQN
jgi:hypothetical protein